MKFTTTKHYNTSECANGYETSIHLAAKRLIDKHKTITLPALKCFVSELGYEVLLIDSNTYTIKDLVLEQSFRNFKPDIIAEVEINSHGKIVYSKLIMEIAVTHFCDDVKIKKIELEGISAIEINLSRIERNVDDKLIWQQMNDLDNLKWLYNARLEYYIQRVIDHEMGKERRIQFFRQRQSKNTTVTIKDYKNRGLSLLKIYRARKIYTGYEVHQYEFDGDIYCPKLNSSLINRKTCEKCVFHHCVVNNYSADEYRVVCGFKCGLKSVHKL